MRLGGGGFQGYDIADLFPSQLGLQLHQGHALDQAGCDFQLYPRIDKLHAIAGYLRTDDHRVVRLGWLVGLLETRPALAEILDILINLLAVDLENFLVNLDALKFRQLKLRLNFHLEIEAHITLSWQLDIVEFDIRLAHRLQPGVLDSIANRLADDGVSHVLVDIFAEAFFDKPTRSSARAKTWYLG